MSKSSNESKQRWNAAHYTQIKVSINPETAEAFKAACAAAGVSMASVFSKFMADYSHKVAKHRQNTEPFTTRRQRRNAVKAILAQMEQLALAEERYMDAIPENLQNSKIYDAADQSVAVMHEVIDLLGEIY